MHMGRLKANELEPRRMASNLLLALVVGLALVPHSSVLAARPLPRAFTPVPLPAPAGTGSASPHGYFRSEPSRFARAAHSHSASVGSR